MKIRYDEELLKNVIDGCLCVLNTTILMILNSQSD